MAGLPDFNSSEEKRARFGKVFAPRVEKLIGFQAVAKTANLEVEFDDALVKKLFVELARRLGQQRTALALSLKSLSKERPSSDLNWPHCCSDGASLHRGSTSVAAVTLSDTRD